MCCASACSLGQIFAAESVLRQAALTHAAARKKVSSTSAAASIEVDNFIESRCVTFSDQSPDSKPILCGAGLTMLCKTYTPGRLVLNDTTRNVVNEASFGPSSARCIGHRA